MNTQELQSLIDKSKETFRFRYVCGGYFRDRTIPKKQSADILHGEEILEEFCKHLIQQLSPSPERDREPFQ